jgi:hypothetical protein
MSSKPTPLALLAHILPQRGPGLLPYEILQRFAEAGLEVSLQRLQDILRYLEHHGMAMAEREDVGLWRYRQATYREWKDG